MIAALLEWNKQLLLNTRDSAIVAIAKLIFNRTRKGDDVLMLFASLLNRQKQYQKCAIYVSKNVN